MKVSVIIPTYNEVSRIQKLVTHLLRHRNNFLAEIIVCDGGSKDATPSKAEAAGARVLQSPYKGRANQMNYAAAKAGGTILYFVHADTIPPATYLSDIVGYVGQGYTAGCYRSQFEDKHPLLKINGFFSRFNRFTCRGGDQTLFVTRSAFEQLNGYNEYYIVMEDFDFIRRVQDHGKFIVMPKTALISARKYQQNAYWVVNLANGLVFLMYRLGFPPRLLLKTYQKMVYYPRYSDGKTSP